MNRRSTSVVPHPTPNGSPRRGFLVGIGAIVGLVLGGAFRLFGGSARRRLLLRPPGALDEEGFLAACTRCGQCIRACPFDTLRLVAPGSSVDSGTPHVIAREVPCYLCQGYDDLLCIAACPTTALEPVSDLRSIRMGTARIDESICLAYNGTICRACWHACPFPNDAIGFDGRLRPVVHRQACIGCGLCEHACPTEPRSIVIEPGVRAVEHTHR